MRISDWSSDVCSSDLGVRVALHARIGRDDVGVEPGAQHAALGFGRRGRASRKQRRHAGRARNKHATDARHRPLRPTGRSEEHTSELQSLMRISYAVFCLKKKKNSKNTHTTIDTRK